MTKWKVIIHYLYTHQAINPFINESGELSYLLSLSLAKHNTQICFSFKKILDSQFEL